MPSLSGGGFLFMVKRPPRGWPSDHVERLSRELIVRLRIAAQVLNAASLVELGEKRPSIPGDTTWMRFDLRCSLLMSSSFDDCDNVTICVRR